MRKCAIVQTLPLVLALLLASAATYASAQDPSGPFKAPVRSMQPVPLNLKLSESLTLPLTLKAPIYSLALSGHIAFQSETALVRVVVTDKHGEDFLVYEGSPLFSDAPDGEVIIIKACEESCALERIEADSLYIQVEGASFDLKSIFVSYKEDKFKPNVRRQGVRAFNRRLKTKQAKAKVGDMNRVLERKRLDGVTTLL